MELTSSKCDTSYTAHKYEERSPAVAVTRSLGNKCGIIGSNGKPDALDAVKLDPAVLEAQVTVEVDTKHNATTAQSNKCEEETNEGNPSASKGFEDMLSQQVSALLSLTPDRLEQLMMYADVLRRQRMSTQKYTECVFCKNNGKSISWYTSHSLKDSRGRVLCPVLRSFRCPRCGATGDHAHTIKYCPNTDTDTQHSAF